MFRESRKPMQKLSDELVMEVLERNTNGVLGVNGDDGYPYTVPLSHFMMNGNLYFHTVNGGYKVEAIRKNPKVSYTVVDADDVKSAEFTSYFRSVILFGKAEIIEDGEEFLAAFDALCDKYSPEQGPEARQKTMDMYSKAAAIVKITIEHISGKEAKQLAEARQRGVL